MRGAYSALRCPRHRCRVIPSGGETTSELRVSAARRSRARWGARFDCGAGLRLFLVSDQALKYPLAADRTEEHANPETRITPFRQLNECADRVVEMEFRRHFREVL